MAYFNMTDYTDFFTDYSLKNGELVNETNINLPTLRLKKELDNVFNILNLLNKNTILPWRDVESYIVGELCQNIGIDNKYYRARKNSTNKRPDLFPEFWSEVNKNEFTNAGEYLTLDNNKEYTPINDYNPATKKYVDDSLLNYMEIGELTGDWNYFVNRGTFLAQPGITNAPNATSKFVVIIGGNKNIYTQIASDVTNGVIYSRNYTGNWTPWKTLASLQNNNIFTGTNTFQTVNNTVTNTDTLNSTTSSLTTANIQNLTVESDATINGDLIVNGTTTTLNSTEVSVDDKNLVLGDIPNPTETTADGGGIILKGTVDKSMLYDKVSNTFVFSNDITTNLKGNADTASAWKTPRNFVLSGDVNGSATIDGSSNTNISVQVVDNSHIHDALYYTKTTIDTEFLRKDQSGTLTGNLNITGNLTVGGDIVGTANKAKYADLAEKYTSNIKYPVGTILTIPKSEEYQVGICKKQDVPFGVVSDKPGMVLNDTIDGVEVALVGQTPVRIIGAIQKGEPITIFDNGVGIKCDFSTSRHLIVGRALETNLDDKEKLVNTAILI